MEGAISDSDSASSDSDPVFSDSSVSAEFASVETSVFVSAFIVSSVSVSWG